MQKKNQKYQPVKQKPNIWHKTGKDYDRNRDKTVVSEELLELDKEKVEQEKNEESKNTGDNK